MSIGFTEAEVLRILAGDAYKAWDADKDMRCGKLLRAMLDPDFRKGYRPALIVVPDTVRDAAQDLLEALEALTEYAEELIDEVNDARYKTGVVEITEPHEVWKARAAIAKAKGEA